MPHQRRERHFEIARLESHAVVQQRGANGGELRGLGAHVRPRSPVAVLQKVEFLAGEMRQVDLDALAEPQLFRETGMRRETLHQGFDMRPFDLNVHRRVRLSSG